MALGAAPADEPLIGSADLQSLADLANGFEVVKGMRSGPVTTTTMVEFAVTTLAPVAPLTLTMISLQQLLQLAPDHVPTSDSSAHVAAELVDDVSTDAVEAQRTPVRPAIRTPDTTIITKG